MVTRQIRSVDIQEREDFDELLRSLCDHARSTVTIDVATGVDVLSIPDEFEDLFLTAQTNAVNIEVVTDDPVRQELARIYGMKVVPGCHCETIELLKASTSKLPDLDAPVGSSEFSFDGTTEISLNGTFTPAPEREPADWSPFETGASYSFVTAPGSAHQPSHRRRSSRRPANGSASTVGRSLGSSSLVVSGFVVAAAVVVLLVALLAPSATIAIVSETQPLTADVTYGLAGSDSQLDLSVEPVSVSTTLTFDASVPASGEMFVPDATARGMIFLTNPNTEPVELAAGTMFTTEGGVTYLSLEPITIPAADPFESARFGTAAVGIEAVDPGPSGNLDVGELTGELASGIIFQNRFPIEGGSLKSVAVVTAEDISALRSTVNEQLEASRSTALDGEIPEGWILADNPQIVEEAVLTFSAEAGAVVDEVAVRAEAVATGHIYDPGELEDAAEQRVLAMLSAGVPEGFGLDVESIRMSTPQVATDAGGPALRIFAEATAVAQFEPGFEEALKDDLTGHGSAYAESALERTAGVESFVVSYGPDWLPWEPIPRLSNRISIAVDGS